VRPGPLLVLTSLLAAGCAPAHARSAAPRPTPQELAVHLSGMIWPLPVARPGEVTSPFGERARRHHEGLDIDGRTGDPIYAARAGRVTFSGWKNGYGNTVVLDHGGGVSTLYGHASSLLVRAGATVERGERIALVGATGNARGDHLHFEVAWAGVPFDPTPLLPELARRR